MPRRSRLDTPGALHHIIVRGIDRGKIFDDDEDRENFLKRLGLILMETKTSCYAWALIPNHFHLLLRTGDVPVTTVMQRLLTGHAVSYNRRYHRHGHLFQNRYKSILCQDDPYFLELVRYIHLNPIRAGLVQDLKSLDGYPYSGHSVIMGNQKHIWQDCKTVLEYFGKRASSSLCIYREFVEAGIEQGRRADLTGGGLLRSSGGWTAVREMRQANIHSKSDERILGDGDFVDRILAEANDALDRKYELRARGICVDDIAQTVANLLDMKLEEVFREGRYKRVVMARSLTCYWAVRGLGVSMALLAQRFKISIGAVSKSVARGAEIAQKEGYELRKLIL